MFFNKKKLQTQSYDAKNKIPMIKVSICYGEQVAGFKDIHTGAFEEDMLIRNSQDLLEFKNKYGITSDIEKFY